MSDGSSHAVLDRFEGLVYVETASLVLDDGGVECHHLSKRLASGHAH